MNEGFSLKLVGALTGAMLLSGSPFGQTAVPPPPPSTPTPSPATIAAAAASSLPHIKFDNTVFDFGKAQASDAIKHTFVFTNTGTATLEITEVRPACGCTTAGEWSKSVEPGKTGNIPIQFNPSTFSGNVAKSVTVTCNDPAQSTIHLQIRGAVYRPVEVNPRYAYFTVREGDQTNQTKIVRIINHEEDPIEVSAPTWDSKAFQVELKTIKPGKEWEVQVSLVPPIESSRSVTPIKLKTTSPKLPEVSISAYAMVQPSFQIIPPQITLPYGPVGQDTHYSVMIRNNNTLPLELSEPAVNADGVTAKVSTTQAGRLFNVEVTFPGGFQMSPRQLVHLTVKSNSKTLPIIRVPITQVNHLMTLQKPKALPVRNTTSVRQ